MAHDRSARFSCGLAARFIAACGAAALAGAALAQPQPPPQPSPVATSTAALRTVSLARGITLEVTDVWTPSAVIYTNAREFVVRGPSGVAEAAGVSSAARMLITTEQRTSLEDAARRLEDIARSRDGTVRFFEIDGWPAVELLFTETLQRRGQRATPAPPQTVQRRITAIAADTTLVNIDVTVVDATRQESRAAVASPLRSFRTEVRPDTAVVRGTVERLQRSDSERRQIVPTPPAPTSTPRSEAPASAPAPAAEAATTVRAASGPSVVPTVMVVPAPEDSAAATGRVAVQGGVGELEIAATRDARNIVIAANGGVSFSNNRGASYTASAVAVFGPNDPSLARARSGAFYLANIAFPTGTPAQLGVAGCTNAVNRSTDNGANFALSGYSARCPQSGAGVCFPDQEHIAADTVNAAAGNNDQVYAVWRNFTPSGTVANCRAIGSGFTASSITCSQDAGANWTATAAIAGSGDFPRVSVGRDGAVYVVTINGNNVLLHRFSACSAGLTQDAGFPVTVASVSGAVACPMPGLDRCNDGNTLASPTVATDPNNADRLWVTFAERSGAGERIVTRTSTNRGANFAAAVTLSAGNTARRFMPWSCATRGRSWAGWYDRSPAVGGATNDLTDYFVGATGGGARNLSGRADPQCASGWPSAPRATGDSDTCTVQPQLAGACMTATGAVTGVRCDFDSPNACAANQTCSLGGGSPKYGDYNGLACTDNFVVAAWTSATAPAGLPATAGGAGLRVFSDTVFVGEEGAAIWRHTGTPCSGENCPGWQKIDNNPKTWNIVAAGPQLYQLHNDGDIWRFTGATCDADACPGWQRLDNNAKTVAIVANPDALYQLHNDGWIWRHTGTPCSGESCPGWVRLDNNPRTIAIAANATQLFQLHADHKIWRHTGTACSGESCPGWVMLDNNPATVALAAGGNQLFQLHRDGRIWRSTGAACSGTACPGWVMLDNNPKAAAIVAASEQLFQLHHDGRIWRSTGAACSGSACPGWVMLDNNPKTAALFASGGQLYQLHHDGWVWRHTGTPCSGEACPGWVRLDNNSRTSTLAAGDQLFQLHSDPVFQRHDDGAAWRYTGTECDGDFCPGWWRYDNNGRTVQLAAAGGQLFQRHNDGRIWRSTGAACSGNGCPGWQMLDNNPKTATIAAAGNAAGGQLFQLHNDGAIWRSDGRACSGAACPGWVRLDNNPKAVAIAAGGTQLYQLHRDGMIWVHNGVPCTGDACPGWTRLDNNPSTRAIAAGGQQLFQLHADGRIWRHTGRPCSGESCPGWVMLDNNPATRAFAAAGAQLYQMHADGRIWRSTGVACSGASCPGWQLLDNNPATREIVASGNRLYQRHASGRIWRYTGPACSGAACPGWRQLDNNPKTTAIAVGGPN